MRFLNGLNSEGDIKVQKPMPRVSAVNPTGEVAGIDLLIASGSGWKIDNDNGTISFKSKAGAADFVEKIRIPSDEEEIYIGATKVSKEGHEHTGVYDNYQGWNLKINSETTGEAITTNEDVTLVGSGSVTVSRVGSTITISSSGSEDTWRPVQDNLTSAETEHSLSANQGRLLKGLIDSHGHTGVGDASMQIKPNNTNEVNFGGTSTSTQIYFGYRATDSRGVPVRYIFGSHVNGTAEVRAKMYSIENKVQLKYNTTTESLDFVFV